MKNKINYFDNLSSIQTKRFKIINCLACLCEKFDLHQKTMHSGIMLMDKYFSEHSLYDNSTMSLTIGIICLGLASKMEEIYYIGINDIFNLPNNKFKLNNLFAMEKKILEYFNYNLHKKTLVEYIDLIRVREKISDHQYYFSSFLAMAILMKSDYLNIKLFNLAEKIVQFTMIFNDKKNSPYQIISDPLYRYIYLVWGSLINSPYHDITNYFKKKVLTKKNKKMFFTDKYYPSLNFKHSINDFDLSNFGHSSIHTIPKKINVYQFDILAQFKPEKKLGCGAFGEVYQINFEHKNIALKKITTEHHNSGISFGMLREISSLFMLNHPNIIKMDGCYYNHGGEPIMYIGMELMDCTLTHYIKNITISKKMEKKLVIQLLDAVGYMHSQKIMHRDLSINNVLIGNNILKIADFGSSRYFYHARKKMHYSNEVCCLPFRAIEILAGSTTYRHKIDIWSCACLIGYILTKSLLFNGETEYNLIVDIFKKLGTPSEKINSKWINLQYMPIYKPEGFIELKDNYPNQLNIINQMLTYNPDQRIEANVALQLFTAIEF